MEPVLHLALECRGKDFEHECIIVGVEGHNTSVMH